MAAFKPGELNRSDIGRLKCLFVEKDMHGMLEQITWVGSRCQYLVKHGVLLPGVQLSVWTALTN